MLLPNGTIPQEKILVIKPLCNTETIYKSGARFKHFHLFGCPAYVLEDDLQDGIKQPKWKPRTKVGVYLGRSKHHANNVSLILNTKTDHISPQYHVVFDDDFQTVPITDDDQEIEVWKLSLIHI